MELKIDFNYKIAKHLRKLYGRNLAREIAFGRKLITFLNKRFSIDKE